MPLPLRIPPETSPTSDPVQASIDRLRVSFVERSLGNLAIIEEMLDGHERLTELAASNPGLIQMAHTLAGSAGIFGFPDIGEAGAELEVILRQPEFSEAELQRALKVLVAELSKLH